MWIEIGLRPSPNTRTLKKHLPSEVDEKPKTKEYLSKGVKVDIQMFRDVTPIDLAKNLLPRGESVTANEFKSTRRTISP